jgi:polysaccharide biosynthesis protein PslH
MATGVRDNCGAAAPLRSPAARRLLALVTLKRLVWKALGKDPEAIVVSFLSGPEPLARAMLEEVMRLVPDREHYAVTELQIPGVVCVPPDELPGPLKRKRIGLAPTLFAGQTALFRRMRSAAFLLAPAKILAYNDRLERHHLRLRTLIASILFLHGVPLDRIFLRPSWLYPFKRDRSRWPESHQELEGRALSEGRPRVAILSPYFPFPLSHGGAVRIYNLLVEAARDFDIFLFAFCDESSPQAAPILDLCAKAILFPNPRYREPRWSTLLPPEVREYRSSYVARMLDEYTARYDLRLLQVEYTQLASYRGDVLVEHDVTFDLYQQVRQRERTMTAWWNWWRWFRYERKIATGYSRVVAMSDKDAALLGTANVRVIPNGVNLRRFHPEPEPSGAHLLFVGSFRHFPNVIAYRFLIEKVWPRLVRRRADLRLTVIAGADPHLYWSASPPDSRIELHGFISDVRPFYAASNIVIVPTQVSAGTNLKVLEAMASARAVVSTTSGCAGLGLVHGESVWIADGADEFADGVLALIADPDRRQAIACAARIHAERNFGWPQLGAIQKRVWKELLTGVSVREGRKSDLPAIARIQGESQSASHWEPPSYFDYHVRVAERDGEVCGFLVSREIVGEVEVLNLAIDPPHRRTGVATTLLESIDAPVVFLEVRESNQAARNLYVKLGFRLVSRREEYYENPVESALVMRLSRIGESDNV